MTGIIDVLMDSFRHEARQARVVIDKTKMANLDLVPSKGMRSLIELVNHLAQIPMIDPAVYSSELDSEEAFKKREMKLHSADIDGALVVFDDGIQNAETRFREMSDEELLKKNMRPFYETGEPKNWAYYIPEMTRHIAMHKMQLWMYLKLDGLDLDMMTYYGVATE
ncbi:MAG: hypothetical protein ACFFEL_12485 [Candidatus Thorarchaeota archaeon]